MASSTDSAIKQRDKSFTLDLNAEALDAIIQRDLGFTHLLKSDTELFDQTELGFTSTRPDQHPTVELYDKRFTLPLRAKLLESLHSHRRLDQHMIDITSICMSRLAVEPAECIVKVGTVEVPLHPPTMFNLLRLKEALVEKHKSMSLILKF